MAPRYRAAVATDAERIALLHAESWRRNYRGLLRDDFLDGPVVANRLDVWRTRLARARDDQFVLLAEDDAALAGFICVYGDEDRRWGSLIDNLHVQHEQRRSGIGTVLMRQAAAWLEARFARSGVYLWVMEANDSARRFYERLGSTDAGVINKEHPDGSIVRTCRYIWETVEELTIY